MGSARLKPCKTVISVLSFSLPQEQYASKGRRSYVIPPPKWATGENWIEEFEKYGDGDSPDGLCPGCGYPFSPTEECREEAPHAICTCQAWGGETPGL